METRYLASEESFASIEGQFKRLKMQPQAPIVPSMQLYRIQHLAVPLLEQGAATTEPPPPPVLLSWRYVCYVTTSPPP